MKKLLRILRTAYSLLGMVFLTGLLAVFFLGWISGRLPVERIQAIALAAMGGGEVPDPDAASAGEEQEPGTDAIPGATGKSESRTPGQILREIERATEDLRMWEDRIDLLGGELDERLVSVGERDQSIEDHQRNWDRVKKNMVPLLNQLLRDTAGWEPITEDELIFAITGESEEGARSGRLSVSDLLDKLRQREEAFRTGAEALKGLDPGVLAGIVVAGLQGGGTSRRGGVEPFRPGLKKDEVVRLLSTLDPSRLARVFKAIGEEDAAQAAALMAVMLRAPSMGESTETPGNPISTSMNPMGQDDTGRLKNQNAGGGGEKGLKG